MLALPIPPRTWSRTGEGDAEWLRFLFRKHVQCLFGWTECREEGSPHSFTKEFNRLLRVTLFPDRPSSIDDGVNATASEGGGTQQVLHSISRALRQQRRMLQYVARRAVQQLADAALLNPGVDIQPPIANTG